MMNVEGSAPASATSMPQASANCVEIVGIVVPLQARTDQRPRHAGAMLLRHTPYAVHQHRLLVHVLEEDGTRYALPLTVPVSTPEQQTWMEALTYGDQVRVQGHLRTEATFDRRFATPDHPDGRPTSTLVVAVDTLSAAPDDTVNGSWVRLTGRISVPPTIRRHERTATEEIGRTSLVVESIVASRRAGSRQQFVRIDRVPLDIPLRIDGSANALRAGNLVTIEGRLEPFQRTLRPQTNAFVKQHLTAVQQHWQAEVATLSASERERRERHHLQQLHRLQSEQRLRVRAGYVDLLEGNPMPVEDARAAHAAFVAQQKQRKRMSTKACTHTLAKESTYGPDPTERPSELSGAPAAAAPRGGRGDWPEPLDGV